jgi:hypothetical protein
MGEEGKVSLGFRGFIFCVEILILSAILGGAWIIDKLLVAPPLILSFRLARVKIETKYDIFHMATIFGCMIVSTTICVFGSYLSLPVTVSFISNVIIGVGFAIITWHLQEIIEIKRNYSFKDEIIAKCKELNYNELKTQIAIKFFVDKEKPKDVWLWLCETQDTPYEWDYVKNLKYRMKKDLF